MSKDTVAIYCRLSVEDADKTKASDDSESIQNQKMLLVDYAIGQGWQIYQIYSDDDYSGLDRDRPEFLKMLSDAREGKFSIILCKHQSRFTRDMELAEKYLHGLFVLWGIRFVSVIDHVDTGIKGNKKSRQINALINEWYVEDLSENIRTVFRNKMLDGQFLGPFASYGFLKDPKDKHKIVVDPTASLIVKRIYDLYIKGFGTAAIAKILTNEHIPTPTQYKLQMGMAYANSNSTTYSSVSGCWAANSVRRILTNKAYIGHLIQGRERKLSYKSKKVAVMPENEWIVIENNHEKIIDENTFYTVQKLMASRRKTRQPIDGSSHDGVKSSYIFAGKMKCADCGGTIQKGSLSRDKSTAYLRCSLSHKTSGAACTKHSIRLDTVISNIDIKIREIFNAFLSNTENANELKKNLQAIHSKDTGYSREIFKLKKELKTVDEKLNDNSIVMASAYADKVKGTISEDDYVSYKAIYSTEADRLSKRKAVLNEELNLMSANIHKASANMPESRINCIPLTHETVNKLIDCILIGERNENNEQDITVNWMF